MQLRCAACGRSMIIREKLEEGDVVTCPNCGKETTYRPSAPAPAAAPAPKPGAPAANAPKPAGGGLTGVPTRLSKPEPSKKKEELPSGGGHGCLAMVVFLVLVGAAAWGCRQFYPAGWQQAVQLVDQCVGKIQSQLKLKK